MSDIVERLRDRNAVILSGLFHAIPAMNEAADEIERLRALSGTQAARTCATCHAVLADGPQPAATYEAAGEIIPSGDYQTLLGQYRRVCAQVEQLKTPSDEALLAAGELYGGQVDRETGLSARREAWNKICAAILSSSASTPSDACSSPDRRERRKTVTVTSTVLPSGADTTACPPQECK